MNKMKKVFLGLAAVLVLGFAVKAQALSIFNQLYQFAIPQSFGSGASDLFAKWAPASRSVSETAAAKNPFDGIALLDGVCSSTTSDEDAYTAVFDSDSVSGITASGTSQGFMVAVKSKVLAATNRDSGKNNSCEFFPVPIPATTGLVHINSTANVRASIIYRPIQK